MTSIAQAAPPAPPPRRTRQFRLKAGGVITETCPTWCTLDHDRPFVVGLTDICHQSDEVQATLDCWEPESVDGGPTYSKTVVMAARVSVFPYSDRATERVPHILFEPFQDEYTDALDPDQFAAVLDRIERHTAILRRVLTLLLTARAEWQGVRR